MAAAAMPWESDPIVGAQPQAAPPSAVAPDVGGNAPPLTIRPRAAAPAAPDAASATPWESDPIEVPNRYDPGAAGAAVLGAVKGIPIAGPVIMGGLNRAAAGLHTLVDGTDYADNLRKAEAVGQAAEEQHPVASTVGQFGGAIAASIPMVAAAPVAFGAEGATMLGRMGLGALTNAAVGGADAAVRSEGDPNAIAAGVGLGALGGAVGGALGRATGQAVVPRASNGVVEAADRLGVTVPKAVASDSRAVQAAGAGLRNVPFAGEPLMQAAESTLAQLGQAADRTADGLGTAGAANAGRGIQDAAQRAADQAAAERAAYKAAMGRQATAGSANANPLTVGGAVQDRIGQFGQEIAAREAAPGQQWTAELGDLAGRLGPADRVGAGQDITGGITRYAQDVLPAQQEAAYEAALSGIPRTARTPLENTRSVAADIMAGRTEGAMPDTTGGAVRMIANAIRDRRGLTIAGLQTLRRSVGETLRNPTLDTNISRGELQRIYGALSDDLGNAVRTHGGPEAAAAFDAANALTREGRQAVRGANRVAQQAPERALRSTVDMAGTDAARLASIRGMVSDEAFASVPAAALADLSTDAAGRISPAAFARRVQAMTPEGSAALFGGHAAQVRELAGRAAMLAHMPPDAERPLADALARLGGGSAEHVLSNILGLASSGTRADIGQLAQLRGVLGEDLWRRVGGALIRRAAFDATTGEFRPDALVKLAETMSPQARMTLFGEGAGRQALDAARGMAGQPFNEAAAAADGLRRSLGASDEGAFTRVAAMASSGSRADIAQLARLRSTMSPQEWADVGATVIKGLGRDVQGQFTPDRFVTAWGKLSGEGKELLFPDKELRSALDDIATVSSRFKELHKYANPSGTARNTAFHVGALGAVWASPLTTISSLVGANALTRVLASPATARSMANWSRAYTAAVTRPAQGARAGLMAASRGLSTTLANHLGVQVSASQLAQGVMSQGDANAHGEHHIP